MANGKRRGGRVERRRGVGHPSARMPTPKTTKRKEGPGAPIKLDDSVTTTLRLERVSLEKIQMIAFNRSRSTKTRVSAADILREAVDEYLRRHPVTLPNP